LGGRLGKVTGLERRPDVEETAPPANSFREGLLNEVAVSVEESLDQGSERALREPLGEAVDRNEATGVKSIVLPFLRYLVVLHLDLERSAAVARHLAVDDEPLTSLEDPLEVGLVEPDGGEKAGAIAEQDGQGCPAPASGRRTHAADGPRARARLPLGDAGERDKLAAILVARGQVKECV